MLMSTPSRVSAPVIRAVITASAIFSPQKSAPGIAAHLAVCKQALSPLEALYRLHGDRSHYAVGLAGLVALGGKEYLYGLHLGVLHAFF